MASQQTYAVAVFAAADMDLLDLYGPWKTRSFADDKAVRLAARLSALGVLSDYYIRVLKIYPARFMDPSLYVPSPP